MKNLGLLSVAAAGSGRCVFVYMEAEAGRASCVFSHPHHEVEPQAL